MDSHENDTNLTNQLDEPPEQLIAESGSDATHPNVKLSSSANTNNSKDNDNIQSNRDHNVPDTNTQQYIRSTIMIGEEIASTSNQCSSSRRKPNLSNQKKSGSSSSSSPIMSPSYNQNNKQYRANIPRAVDLVENLKHSYDNKENVPGIQSHHGSQSEHRLDSPKYALLQNSPNTPLSSYKSPPSTHSSPMYTAHEIRTDCPMFTYSPLITEPYKHSTYFHFPDVDTPSSIDGKPAQQTTPKPTGFNNNVVSTSDSDAKTNESTNVNNINNNNNNNNNNSHNNNNNNNVNDAKPKCSSANSPQIIVPDESRGSGDGTKQRKEASVRRARLKSISLDSDGARLVEENLCIPVEELVERTLPQTTQFDYDDTTSFYTPTNFDISTANKTHQPQPSSNNMKHLSKKINHLVLDLSITDDSLRHIDYQISPLAADDISTITPTTTVDTIDGHSKYSQKIDTNSNNRSTSATTPKTPTLTKSRQKAASLDSEPKSNEYDRSPSVQSTSTDSVGGNAINMHGNNLGIGMGTAGHMSILRNKSHLMPNFLCVESNSSMSVPTTPKRQQLVKKTLNKFNAHPGKLNVGRKSTFAANAEYYSNKKTGQERKYNEKIHISSDTEPIFEGHLYDDVYTLETDTTSSFETASCDDVDCEVIGGPDMGLRSNIGMAALSLSNYSLSNFQGSHCSLTRSNHNIFGMTNTGGHQFGPKSSKSTNMISSSSSNACKTVSNPITVQHQQQQQKSYQNQTTRTNFSTKKNLLQRRGSNTSLTLNIVGGAHTMSNTTNHSTLNRFNSHNALNDMQRTTNAMQTGKKLLERRNSNASLTIQVECRSNVPKRALSTSMSYLRGSDLSLNNSVNNFESPEHQVCTLCGGVGILKSKHLKRQSNTESIERTDNIASAYEDLMESSHENQSKYAEYEENIDAKHSNVARDSQRKFFSSENLNVQNTFSICQMPIKTSSVVDLNQANGDSVEYCPCSTNITRNITTKPLSPQTTSEDFKIYLANIQMLQNASHLLTETKLSALGQIFNRSYASAMDQRYDGTDPVIDSNKLCRSCETCTICKMCKLCETKCRCVQNCLLRSVHQEFWDLPTNYQEKPLVSGSHAKNRYKTILPNEHSRVILEPEYALSTTFAHNQEQSTAEHYINANYIKGPDYTQNAYIATQGPMMNTIYDFWLMIYQNYRKNLKSIENPIDIQPYQQKIAMLTDIIENDESKCAMYFSPNTGNTMCFLSNRERNRKNHRQSQMRLDSYFNNYSSKLFDRIKPNEIYTEILSDDDCQLPEFEFNFFVIQTVDCANKGGYSMRKFHCLYYTCEQSMDATNSDANGDDDLTPTMPNTFERKLHLFAVYHYWFPHWPDHRSPENIDAVLDMCINLIDADCDEEIRMGASYGGRDDAAPNTIKSNKLSETPLLLNELSKPDPMPIIHCSAGIGRTGCVIGILNGLRQLKQSYLSTPSDSASNGKNASVDILGIVSNLRLQRGGMVQNSEQYELIHRALCLYHQRYLSNCNNKK